jgi:DNA primase
MTTDELIVLLKKLGFEKVILRNSNVMACCPNPAHQETRPSWGVSVNAPHFHGCFSCGYKGTLAQLLKERGYAAIQIEALTESSVKDFAIAQWDKERASLEEVDYRLLFPFKSAVEAEFSAKYLQKRRIKTKTAQKANLLYDHFKSRLLFQWKCDGLLIGVTGRAIDPTEKYKTLPYFGTQKGQCFYLPEGKFFPERKRFILVEGEIDALRVLQGGYQPVGALGFGAITTRAVDLLMEKMPKLEEIILFFDDDETGERLSKTAFKKFSTKLKISKVDYHGVRNSVDENKLDPAELDDGDILPLILDRKKRADWPEF